MSSDLTPHLFLLMPAMYTPSLDSRTMSRRAQQQETWGIPTRKTISELQLAGRLPQASPSLKTQTEEARRASASPKDYDEMLLSRF